MRLKETQIEGCKELGVKLIYYHITLWGENLTKEKSINKLISSEKVNLYMLQETKMKIVEESKVHYLRGSKEVIWMAKWNIGSLKGMLLMWKHDIFKTFFQF